MVNLVLFATLASAFIIQKTTLVSGPARVMSYINLSPVFVALLTMLIERSTLPTAIYPGMFLSIAASLFYNVKIETLKAHLTPFQ